MNVIFEMFDYDFMMRALIVGALLSLVSGLIGVSLVLRNKSMIGDGLSHVAFGTFAIATVLGLTPIYVAIPTVIVLSFFVLSLSDNKKIGGDATIALLSAGSLAIGTLAISVSKGVNIDLNSYLFGSILSVGSKDVFTSAVLAGIVVVLFLFSYNRIFAITFDEEFARAIGVRVKVFDMVFSVICSVVIVLGMRLLGALLISSLIIFPTVIAREFSRSFRGVVFFSAVISVVNFIVGLVLSYILGTPTGAMVVLVNLGILAIAKVVGRTK